MGLIDERRIAVQGPLLRASVVGPVGKGRDAKTVRDGEYLGYQIDLIVGRREASVVGFWGNSPLLLATLAMGATGESRCDTSSSCSTKRISYPVRCVRVLRVHGILICCLSDFGTTVPQGGGGVLVTTLCGLCGLWDLN